MQTGDRIFVKGFVTQQKYLAGRNLRLIESLLGLHTGRLAAGATILALDRLPGLNEFETAGYSQVAGHRHRPPSDLDPVGLRRLAMSAWTWSGPNGLIKVIPSIGHNPAMSDDAQYPPGEGIPQWKLISPISATVVASLHGLEDVFRPV